MTRKEISKIKTDFVLKREKLIRAKMSTYQLDLFDKLFNKYLKDIVGKKFSYAEELKVINSIEKTVKEFSINANTSILKDYSDSAFSLGNWTMRYYATMFDDVKKLDLIRKKTVEVQKRKLGLKPDGTIKPNGFFDKVIADPSIQKQVAKEVRKAITNNYDLLKLQESFKKIIVGSPEQSGIFERHYNTFAKDVLNSIDNANSKIYADELELRHAYYGGGLMLTSHDICIENNGKIFSTKQIENLRNDPRIVKMYENYPGEYDPFELPGGFGCKHHWDYITADLAKRITASQNKKAAQRNSAFVKRNKL